MKYGKNYKAWNINAKDFPESATLEEKIVFFIRYGILAPSTHNIQPWKFEVKDDILTVFPDWKYQLPLSDPTNRGLFVSLGACTTNIIVAASHFNYATTVSYYGEKQEKFFIQIQFMKNKKQDKDVASFFPSIVKRYSNKLDYSAQKIDQRIIKNLEDIEIGGAKAMIVDDQSLIENVASFHKKAVLELMSPPIFRIEITKWLRHNNTQQYDGMPGFVVGMPQLLSVIAKKIFPNLPILPRKMAEKDYKLLRRSPAIGVIFTKNDDISSFVDVGRTYELLTLKAIAASINTTPMAALIENKKYTPLLGDLLSLKKEKLQFFFRLGYSDHRAYHTPRIPLELVLK